MKFIKINHKVDLQTIKRNDCAWMDSGKKNKNACFSLIAFTLNYPTQKSLFHITHTHIYDSVQFQVIKVCTLRCQLQYSRNSLVSSSTSRKQSLRECDIISCGKLGITPMQRLSELLVFAAAGAPDICDLDGILYQNFFFFSEFCYF